jgi:N-acetylglucosaminyldiphosphoundecaprenol N-acetyl-beta-D-mannosaminyltransferase
MVSWDVMLPIPSGVSMTTVRKVEICGLHVDAVSFEETLDLIERAVEERKAGRLSRPRALFSANVDMLVKASRDPAFARDLEAADLLLADGAPLLWMAGAIGSPLPERVAGSDLVPRLAARAADRQFSLFLLGSAPGVAARAADRLVREHPGLRIAGTISPPMGFEHSVSERARIREALCAAAPDVVLVGLGAPKQERWILSERTIAPAAVFIAVGGTFDMLANAKRRAPRVLQHVGLEWAWRLAQEPKRLGRRYLLEDPAVLLLFAGAAWRRLRGR